MSKKINEQVNDDGDGNKIIVESTSEKPNEAKHDHFSNVVLSGLR